MIVSNSINGETFFRNRYLGLCAYHEVAERQKRVAEKIRNTRSIYIYGMQFEPVITLGVRGHFEQDLLNTQSDIPIVKTDRGGQATMHTPGQLVIYPCLDLKQHRLGVKDFVCLIVKTTGNVLKTFGIETNQGESPGLYTARGKIAFIGIRVDRGVVRHGIAINVGNELAAFGSIRSCGISGAAVDKMQNYREGETFDLGLLFQQWVEAFEYQFKHFEAKESKELYKTNN